MRQKEKLQSIIDKIASADSPVGMDAVYAHASILDQLQSINERLERLESEDESFESSD
jgi:hypothetical protein